MMILLIFLFGLVSSDDPFALLGIPVLNPSSLFSEERQSPLLESPLNMAHEGPSSYKYNSKFDKISEKGIFDNNMSNFLRENINISDSPKKSNLKKHKIKNQVNNESEVLNFLTQSGLKREDGINTVSRFLLSQNTNLKNIGVIYDKTDFSGLQPQEVISTNSEERYLQKAKSAANLFFNYMKIPNYGAFGAEENPNIKTIGWKNFRVLMASPTDKVIVTVCLPFDGMLCPIVKKDTIDCNNEVSFFTIIKIIFYFRLIFN